METEQEIGQKANSGANLKVHYLNFKKSLKSASKSLSNDDQASFSSTKSGSSEKINKTKFSLASLNKNSDSFAEARSAKKLSSSSLYQSSLKLEQNPALVYQGTLQCGDADYSARKNLYWNPKDSGIYKNLPSISDSIESILPSIPVYCFRPQAIKTAAAFFIKNFSNSLKTKKSKSRKKSPEQSYINNRREILYSVKSNPEEAVLKNLFDSGIKHFDVASAAEINLIHRLFGKNAKMYFMHPIKSPESISLAYNQFGIRDFSLDSFDELDKILHATNNAKDLGLHIRLSIPNSHSAIDLSGKFGILPSDSQGLLRKCRTIAKRLGICFHVGSQCMDPVEYRGAIMIASEACESAGVKLDVLDIGGGFPSSYPTLTPPSLQSYFDEIFDAISAADFGENFQIWCEPGRALVADSTSLVVRVEARKGQMLYLNDGTYGGLFDAGYPGFTYPAKAMRFGNKSALNEEKTAFGFYGPTCDSLDCMRGPFFLPSNIAAGDYIEIGQLGAYSRSIRTRFNGFDENQQIEVCDQPIVSLYAQPDLSFNEKSITKKF